MSDGLDGVGKQTAAIIGALVGLATLAGAGYAAVNYIEIAPAKAAVARVEQERDAALAQIEQLQRAHQAQAQAAGSERTCLSVLPSWQKAVTECRSSLASYSSNCSILQNVHALNSETNGVNQRIDWLTREGLGTRRKESLGIGEQAELADLSRQRELIHARILSLQAKLQCTNES